MKYDFHGPRPKGVSAETAGAELQRLHETAPLTPDAIVEAAEPEDAPLHPAFEWDDAIAAADHRRQQARGLVRAVVLRAEPDKHESLPTVRAFVSVHRPQSDRPLARIYRPIMEVIEDENRDDVTQLKQQMLREMAALRERYVSVLDLDEALRSAFELAESALT